MQFLPVIEAKPALTLVVSSEMPDQQLCKNVKKIVEEIASSGEFAEQLNFFHTEGPDDVATSFVYIILQMPELQRPFIVITEPPIERKRYMLDKDLTAADSVRKFIRGYLAKTVKSLPVPVVDLVDEMKKLKI